MEIIMQIFGKNIKIENIDHVGPKVDLTGTC